MAIELYLKGYSVKEPSKLNFANMLVFYDLRGYI